MRSESAVVVFGRFDREHLNRCTRSPSLGRTSSSWLWKPFMELMTFTVENTGRPFISPIVDHYENLGNSWVGRVPNATMSHFTYKTDRANDAPFAKKRPKISNALRMKRIAGKLATKLTKCYAVTWEWEWILIKNETHKRTVELMRTDKCIVVMSMVT